MALLSFGGTLSAIVWRRVGDIVYHNRMELCQDAEFDQLGEEELDALFEEYGETVRNDSESSNVTSEVDDDSDSLACESQDSVSTPCCLFLISRIMFNYPFLGFEVVIIRIYSLKLQLLRVSSYSFNCYQEVQSLLC